jgi:hypothetical protein
MPHPFLPIPLAPLVRVLILDAVALTLLGAGAYLNDQQPGPLASILLVLGSLVLAAGVLVFMLALRAGKSPFNPPRT